MNVLFDSDFPNYFIWSVFSYLYNINNYCYENKNEVKILFD